MFSLSDKSVLEIRTNYRTDNMAIGENVIATLYVDGIVQSTGVAWSVLPLGVVTVSPEIGGRVRIIAKVPGPCVIMATITLNGSSQTATLRCQVAGTPPTPPPPPPPVVKVQTNYAVDRMNVGMSVIATLTVNGVTVPKPTWAVTGSSVKTAVDSGMYLRITGAAPGSTTIVGSDGAGHSASIVATVLGAPTPTPPPTPTPDPTPAPSPSPQPPPAVVAPAAAWKRIRDHICLVSTDFYYNWTLAIEQIAALRYDIFYSGDPARHARMKLLNPYGRFLPYSIEVTTIVPGAAGASLGTCYADDFAAWCTANGISAAAQEAAWLHKPGTFDKANRVSLTIWGSLRWMLDPTDDTARRYTVDRYRRLAGVAVVDGMFADEFGSGQMLSYYKLAAGSDTLRLLALTDAETSLIALIAAAIAPKQLVLNAAGYELAWDAALSRAAMGAHMEQTNNPMTMDWWATTWAYIDQLLASGVFVNFVPLYDFGRYELLYDGKAPAPSPFPTPQLARGTRTSAHAQPAQAVDNDAQRWLGHPLRAPMPTGTVRRVATKLKYKVTRTLAALAQTMRTLGVGTAMDTHRGKLLELAGAYMVITDPALLGLSIENGFWGTFTAATNYLPEIDAKIGRAKEKRQRGPVGTHYFTRRFDNGLVVVNPIWNRLQQDYSAAAAVTIPLPSDRRYARVNADGSLAAPSTSVTLRTPEAAIFLAV